MDRPLYLWRGPVLFADIDIVVLNTYILFSGCRDCIVFGWFHIW